MDLRIERTRKSIINAFIELRSKKPIEKITVKELAELAYINKATFYSHYNDIYDLSEQIENEVISSVVAGIRDTEKFITNPKEGTDELFDAFWAKNSLLNILFSGSRAYVFSQKMEKILKEHIFKTYPEYQEDLEKNILFSVLIQGCFRAYLYYSEDNRDEVIRIIGNINNCLLNEYTPIK